MERALWHLLVGTRGGLKRAEIIRLLDRRPYNANEISRLLGVDYKTARHHLRVLIENGVLTADESRYGTLYFWSANLKANRAEWNAIAASLAAGDEAALATRFGRASGKPVTSDRL